MGLNMVQNEVMKKIEVRRSELTKKQIQEFNEVVAAGWTATVDYQGERWLVAKAIFNGNEPGYRLTEHLEP